MELISVYNEVKKRLSKIRFEEIWTGFHLFNFSLYDDKKAVIHDTVIDKPENFFANTSEVYNGETIAIWDISDFDGDFDLLTANLVHEMFHCFQNENGESRYPSDLELLIYPDSLENYELKQTENAMLADSVLSGRTVDLGKILRCRGLRAGLIGAVIGQEYRAETIEGAAEYAGMTALLHLSPEKYRARLEKYCAMIAEPSPLLFDIRRICYYTGTLLMLLYRKAGLDDFPFTDKPHFETVKEKTAEEGIAIRSYPDIREMLRDTVKKREKEISSFRESHPVFTEARGFICGYDPMNMIRCGDYILCSHLVFLNVSGKTRQIMQPVLLQMEKNDSCHVAGYYL